MSAAANMVEVLCQHAERHPERRALSWLGAGQEALRSFSYGELHRAAAIGALQLREHAAPGARALLLYPPGPAYVLGFLSCLYSGIVPVPAFPPEPHQRQQLERVLGIFRGAKPTLVLTEAALVPALQRALGSLCDAARVKVLAPDEGAAMADAGGSTHEAHWRMPALGAESIAFLQYTSGSTRAPRGVVVSHANLLANERCIQRAFALTADDVVLSWLPLFHDMGLVGTLLQPLYSGATAILLSPQQFMARPACWVEAISRHGATVSGGPDFAYRLCAERTPAELLSTLDLGRWRLAFCGSEPVRAATLDAFSARFAAARFDRTALYPCYGLAESTLLVSGGTPGSGPRVRRFAREALALSRVAPQADGQALVSAGRVQPGYALALVDPESGEPVAEGTIGAIELSGECVARAYFEDGEASAEVFVGRGERVVLRTGDLGFVHDGELFITGRHKDLIIVRGQNLYPQDIEQSVEDAVEVARKGRSAAFAIETPHAEGIAIAIELSPRLQKVIDVDAVCARISQVVAREHGEPPAVVLLVNPGGIPMTSSGKVQRGACKRGWLEGSLDVRAARPSVQEQARPNPRAVQPVAADTRGDA